MKNKHILLVGCGNLGSRHLQGLAKMISPLTISVVEPNSESVNTAKSRLCEIPQDVHEISWYEDVDEISTESDLVIVSTNSIGRTALISKLLKNGHSRFLVEKIVCQSTEEYNILLNEMNRYNAKGWVDTSKRYYPFYQQMKNYFKDSSKIYLSVTSGNIGLGTNAIHFIDLFSWLLGSTKIKLNGDFLYKEVFPNKRGSDYVEFAGTIIGTSDDSLLIISSLTLGNYPTTVDISGNGKRVLIDETNEKVYLLDNITKMNDDFNMIYQSNLTNKIVEDIFLTDNCLLPSLSESLSTHSELFRIFNNHIKKIQNKDPKLCPIT